jgi:hypothetical protein
MSLSASSEPSGPHEVSDTSRELDHEDSFFLFVARCLSHIEATGCREVRQLTEGIRRIHHQWDLKRNHAKATDTETLAAQVSTLDWALRCIAHAAWTGHPGWDQSFHPPAAVPDARKGSA